jgi:hypothetical protein
MSKQSEAKAAQGYRTEQRNCENCTHRRCERELPAWMRRENERTPDYWRVERDGIESKQRCGLGDFAIRKTATCDHWLLASA